MTSKNQVLQCSGKEERMHAEVDQIYMGQLQSWLENIVFQPLKIIISLVGTLLK